ncbi:MAG: hypothetical protein HPY69_00595 [Armatimonadetes bacterium]|nr:hypothetical protein [Armatimonadota bacterium]
MGKRNGHSASKLTVRVRLRVPQWRAILLPAALLLCALPAAFAAGRALALVGGEEITEEELRAELVRRFGARVLLEMIDTRLIREAATREGVGVSDSEVQLKYEQVVARVGSEADLQRKLELLGRSPEEFRQQVRDDALLDRLAIRHLDLSEAEVEAYYQAHLAEFSRGEQVRARLMLFSQRENAEAVAEALKAPDADFAGLAKAFSEDPATREKGGDMGYFSREDYAREISDAAFALNPGETSDILTVPDGYAIVRVEGRRPAGPIPLAEIAPAVRARMELELLEAARLDWLHNARTSARLEIPDPELERQVRILIDANQPYDVTNITPELPVAPR